MTSVNDLRKYICASGMSRPYHVETVYPHDSVIIGLRYISQPLQIRLDEIRLSRNRAAELSFYIADMG